jgi:phage-related protein (TIGR01555 family)
MPRKRADGPAVNPIIPLKEAAERQVDRLRQERLDGMVQRQDRWVNWATGLGTFKDKTRHGYFEQPIRLTDVEITSLASGNDLAAKAIEKRPFEMFRRGYELEPQAGDDEEEINKGDVDELRKFAEEKLRLDLRMRQGMVFGRQYGGSVLILGINDGRYPWEPVDERNIQSIDFINQVDRRFSYVQSYYSDYMSPNYGEAQTYLVANAVATSTYRNVNNTFRMKKNVALDPGENYQQNGPAGGYSVLNVHESRIVRFDGVEADVITRQMLAGWSWSILQRAYETLRLCDMGFDSLAYLIADASQGVMKLKGLLKGLSVPGQREQVEKRLQLIDESRSVMRSIALDPEGGEDFTRVPTQFAGIPDAVDRLMQRLAAALDMPVTELFGISPAGLNATGQNDRLHWYETISTDQENDLAPRLRRVYRLLALAKRGPLKGKDVHFKIKFNALHTPSDADLAQTRFVNAQRDNLYATMGAVSAEEIAVNLDDVYPHLDTEAREKMINAQKSFDPHGNDPEPEPGQPGGPPLPPAGQDPTGGAGGSGTVAD